MEDIASRWKEEEEAATEEEAEVEEIGLLRRQAHEQEAAVTTTTTTTITSVTSSYIIEGQEISETSDISSFSDIEKKNITLLGNVTTETENGQGISETREISSFSDIEKRNITLPSSDPVVSSDLTSLYNVMIEREKGQETSEVKDSPSSSDVVISRVLTSLDNVTIESVQRQEISEIKDNPSSSDPVISRVLTSVDNVAIESEKRQEISEIKDNPSSSDLVISRDLPSAYIESERAGVITENIQLVKELYLESLYQKTPKQGFYCPNCKTCIQKVLILDTVRPEPDSFRCPTCFSFLIPIGRWVFPWWVPDKKEITEHAPETKVPSPIQVSPYSRGETLQPEPKITDDAPRAQEQQPPVEGVVANGVSTDLPHQDIQIPESGQVPEGKKPQVDASKVPELKQPVEEFVQAAEARTDPSDIAIEIQQDEQVPDESRAKPSPWKVLPVIASAIVRPRKPEADISEIPQQQKPVEEVVVVHDEESTEPVGSTTPVPTTSAVAVEEAESRKSWDILKSIVYGGLIESIASLSIVTSSASADASTLSILTLSLANIVGGLFVLVHHIWDLKSEQQTTNEKVDRYFLSLGKRENFYLHVFIAILSFIIFGLVPPLVYGLTYYTTTDKDLTLLAVAGASIICITLLAIAKTYIQRPNTYLTYLKSVIYYLSTGALTSVFAYLVGVLIRRLLEQVGFSSASSLEGFNLIQSELSLIEKSRFGSY